MLEHSAALQSGSLRLSSHIKSCSVLHPASAIAPSIWNRAAQHRRYHHPYWHVNMCFFIYPQCDRCRWPEINNLRSVRLCDTFKKLAHDREARAALSRTDPSPNDLAEWRCLDLYTFVRAGGSNYEIWMQRECLRWGPELRSHLCRHCEERDARLTAAFELAAHDLIQRADIVEVQAPGANSPARGPAVPQSSQHDTSFDPSLTDAETNIDWERLMGPSPLRMWSVVEAEQPVLDPKNAP